MNSKRTERMDKMKEEGAKKNEARMHDNERYFALFIKISHFHDDDSNSETNSNQGRDDEDEDEDENEDEDEDEDETR